jgi:hypothetical protein
MCISASLHSQEQAALQSDLKQRAASRAFAAEAIELERYSRLSPELKQTTSAPVDQHTAHALRRQATMAAEQERQRQITELHAHYMSERASADAERNERRRAVAERVAAEKLRQIEQHAALVDQGYKNDRLQRRASLTHTAAMMEQGSSNIFLIMHLMKCLIMFWVLFRASASIGGRGRAGVCASTVADIRSSSTRRRARGRRARAKSTRARASTSRAFQSEHGTGRDSKI